MNHAITLGDLLRVGGGIAGIVIIIWGLLALLAAYARGMSR